VSDEKKFPPDLGLEVDPDATAVVDARRVWAALEKVDKLGAGASTSGESSAVIVSASKDSPPAPASATRPVDVVEEEAEALDDGWGDDLLEDDPDPAPAAAPPAPPAPPAANAPPASPAARVPPAPPVASAVAEAALAAPANAAASESNTLSGLGTRAPVVASPSPVSPLEAISTNAERTPEPLPSDPAPSQSRISTARPPPGEVLVDTASAGVASLDLGSTRPPSPSSIVTPVGGMPAVHEDAHARATPVPEAPAEPVPEVEVPKASPKPRRHGPSAVEMEDRFSIGDFAGAMEIAEELLARDPDHEEAKECVERSRVALRELYTSRLGPLDRVPVVAVARDQMRWLTIDHRAGFILSHVDGISNLEEIVDISGMAELDALRILSELVQQRIIALR
jgi:hypothetical protein